MNFIKFKITIIIMGLCLYIALFLYIENIFPNKSEFNIIGLVVSPKEEMKYYDKYIIKILHNSKYKNTRNFKIIMYSEKANKFEPGDVLRINGAFEKGTKSRNYKGFSYYNYLRQKNIYGIIREAKIEKISKKTTIYTELIKVRQNLSNKLFEIYDKKYAGFLDGLLLGKTDTLSEEINSDFKDSSISHILAISGTHIVYVISGVKVIFDKFIDNKKIKNYLLIIFVFLFYILTGSTVSCIRACIMSSLAIFSTNIYRKNNFYISLFFSFLIIIFLNPYNILNVGMWLSYAGTLGIVLFYNFFVMIFKVKKVRKSKITKFIFDNFFITISAQILIFPIMIYNFNVTSLTFFIPNILISLFINLVMSIGYISILISYIIFPIAKIISYFESILIEGILIIAKICANLPLTKIYSKTPSFLCVIFYYVLCGVIIYVVKNNKMLILRFVISKKYLIIYFNKLIIEIRNIMKNIMKNVIKNKILFFIKILLIVFIIFILKNIINEERLEIYFIDVGQGDSCLIKTPKEKIILIDGGEGGTDKYDYGENVLVPYLLDRKISKIDYLFISHTDSDHIGGLFAVIKTLKVNKILIGIQPENSIQLEELIKISEEKNIEIIFLKASDKLKVEENINIDIIWPIKNKFITENALNNNSLVFKLNYNRFSILFTGDIEKVAEEHILKQEEINNKILNSTILKVSHHGSKTSTTLEFLEKTNPRIALIGVGEGNNFGHPSKEIIKNLENIECKIYRTDINGEIEIKVDKVGKLNIRTKFR